MSQYVKSIIPFFVDADVFDKMVVDTPLQCLIGKSTPMLDDVEPLQDFASENVVRNPIGESSIGFADVEAELIASTDGANVTMLIERRERLLPKDVVDRAVRARAKRIQEDTGVYPRRRQLTEIRDEIRASMLPKALIRSRQYPVTLHRKDGKVWMMIMNASDKVAETIFAFLKGTVFGPCIVEMTPLFAAIETPIEQYLRKVLVLDVYVADSDLSKRLHANVRPDINVKLKHPENGSVSIKALSSDGIDTAVREYVEEGFDVIQLGVASVLTGEDTLWFKISKSGRFFGFSASGSRIEEYAGESEDAQAGFCAEAFVFTNEVIAQVELIKEVCGEKG